MGRRLGRTLGIYATAAFGGLQLLDLISDRLELSDRFFLAALIVLALGVPIIAGLAVAAAVADDAPARSPARFPSPGLWWRPGAQAAGLVVLVVAVVSAAMVGTASRVRADHDPGEGDRDRVLVADFRSRTGQDATGAVLAEALRIDLEARPGLDALRPVGVWGTIAAGWSDDGAGSELARTLAVRSGVRMVVEGEVDRVGASYVLAVRVFGLPDGSVVASERATAQDSTALLAALERVSASLGPALGRASKGQGGPSLPRATHDTRALTHYVRGITSLEIHGDTAAAVQELRRAVAADRRFALAQHALAGILTRQGDAAAAAAALTAAYPNRHRLTDAEWYALLTDYHRTVNHDEARARPAAAMLAAMGAPGP
jgi:hypothetical protein